MFQLSIDTSINLETSASHRFSNSKGSLHMNKWPPFPMNKRTMKSPVWLNKTDLLQLLILVPSGGQHMAVIPCINPVYSVYVRILTPYTKNSHTVGFIGNVTDYPLLINGISRIQRVAQLTFIRIFFCIFLLIPTILIHWRSSLQAVATA